MQQGDRDEFKDCRIIIPFVAFCFRSEPFSLPDMQTVLDGGHIEVEWFSMSRIYNIWMSMCSTNQSGAAEAWWAHNPQVPGSKPGSDKKSGFQRYKFFIIPSHFRKRRRFRL